MRSEPPAQAHPGGQELSWTTNVTPSIPCSIPTGGCQHLVPGEQSPSSPAHRAGTRHATAWRVFPGLPKQPQKHNKQQQHTADSRQTFPSYFLPSSVCAFSPLPQGSCCHRKGTTILFLSAACAIPAGAAVQSRGIARDAAAPGEEPGTAELSPCLCHGHLELLTCLLRAA